MSHSYGPSTRALHAGRRSDPSTGALLTPIFQTSTFVQDGVGQHKGFTYSRCANPTVSALEEALCGFAETDHALAFKTGLAALTTLFLGALQAGDHVVAGAVIYGGTVRLLRDVLGPFGVEVTFVDATDLDAVRAAVRPETKLVFAETPANPTLAVCDLAGLEHIARDAGALFVIDNTFLTPALQPVLPTRAGRAPYAPDDARLSGADIEVLSTTKYIEGHNATTGGALLTADAKWAERFHLLRGATGSIQAPFDAWLTQRGLGTLPLRLERHSQSARTVAEFLDAHAAVARVFYPGLGEAPSRPAGGMLAFELSGSQPSAAALRLLSATKLCALAENLGAAETLITHPASMTHSQIPPDEREKLGITKGLIRLSVGLEDVVDIVADLELALAAADPFASTGQSGGVAEGGAL